MLDQIAARAATSLVQADFSPFRLCIAVLAFFFVYIITSSILTSISRERFRIKNHCQPLFRYYPFRDPIFGLDLVTDTLKAIREKRFLDTLNERFEKIGMTYGVRVFNRRAIFTNEPDNIKTVLSLRFKDYTVANRPPVMGPLLGKGIFTVDGEEWSHSRTMLRASFMKDRLANLATFESCVQDMFQLLPRDGSTVDLQNLFFRFTIDTATEFLFGRSVHTLRRGSEAGRRFTDAFDFSQAEITKTFCLGPFRRLQRNPQAQAAYKVCRSYADQFVDEALAIRKKCRENGRDMAEKGAEANFMQQLANATDDKNKIRDELLNILIAGRDTTASLLSNLFFTLARKPEVWKKLREEVKHLDGRAPNYEELWDLKYARYCLQEALRLYPSVPLNGRIAMRDTILPMGGGPNGDLPLLVPKGCIIVYSVYAMHRRKDFFGEDALDFRPERWDERRHSWEYLPFNGGPRICLGQQYALTEALYILTRMVQEFAVVEPRNSQPWTESVTITVSSANGVKVALRWA